MIQILGLRSFTPNGETVNFDKIFDTGLCIETVQELFSRLPEVLSRISPSEHWNLFYTLANCGEKKRAFESTAALAFDIDGFERERGKEYEPIIRALLQVDPEQLAVVSSGNGLHFVMQLETRVTDRNFFTEQRPHYKAVAAKINAALLAAGLPGKADTAIFDARRILRLPGTKNIKPGKPERMCKLIRTMTQPVDFCLATISGLPLLKKTDSLPPAVTKRQTQNFPSAVLEGCSFLSHCYTSAASLDEPTWYAALSVVARLDGEGATGRERAHQLSSGHPGYSVEETDKKIDQALNASGPRTCDYIKNMWDGCPKCPNFGKVSSPIMLAPKDAIGTEHTGFHTVGVDSKGKPKSTPNYEDLISFFSREHKFKVLADSRQVCVWNKHHYEPMQKPSMEAFSRKYFDPKPEVKVMEEFRKRLTVANIVPMVWWQDSIKRKMNFLNGYLDIDSMEFRPHDIDLAFRNILPYEYDPTARAPLFEHMLGQVTAGNNDLQKILMEFVGYALSNDDCWAQKVLVLVGDGANGKSTFLNIVKDLVGWGNYTSISMPDLAKSEYSRHMLDGKLFNISDETPTKALLDSSIFKSLATGGEVQARPIYGSPYTVRNKAKLFFNCNDMPESSDSSYGFFRRLIIVPFTQVFTKDQGGYDPHIEAKLRGELAGIFNLAMTGYHRLVRQGAFTESEVVKRTVDEYQTESDSVLYWAKEYLVVHTNGGFDAHSAPIGDMYKAYADIMKAEQRYPITKSKFEKRLSKLSGEVWGEHPYRERATKIYVDQKGKKKQVRALKGVEIESIN